MNRLNRTVLLIAGAVGAVYLLSWTGPLWRSLLVAALLAYLLNPVVNWLAPRLWQRRGLAVAVVCLALVLPLLGGLTAAGAALWGQVPVWLQELQDALSALREVLARPFSLLGFSINPQALLDYLQTAASNALTDLSTGSGGLVSGLADNLLWTTVIVVSFYYLLRDGHRLLPTLLQWLPSAYVDEARELLSSLDHVWRVFLRVQLLIFAVISVLVLLSTSLIILLFRQGWLQLSPFGLVILLLVVYTAIQQVDNLWLRPQYMGQALQLHPGVSLVSLLAALALTGVLGALLVIPVLASLKLVIQHGYAHGWFGVKRALAEEE